VVYDQIFDRKAGREEGKEAALPQIRNPQKYAPELAGTLHEVNARAIAEQLLGAGVGFSGDHAIFKPAGVGAPTPWHSLSVWMPLQEATPENGCMTFIPGRSDQEVQPHQSIGGDSRIHGLEMLNPAAEAKAVACPLPPGGATFHDSRTAHFTGANKSAVPRRAYILIFGTGTTRRTDGRTFPWNDARSSARDARAAEAARTLNVPA